MGQPAARLTDMHTCPMVTGIVPHVGGPIVAPGCPTVLIGKLPAARLSDECVCIGPLDIIVEGAFTTLIGGLPAARLGDMTAHGGVIVMGDFTVLIGDGASGSNSDGDTDQEGEEPPEEEAPDQGPEDEDQSYDQGAQESQAPEESQSQAPADTPPQEEAMRATAYNLDGTPGYTAGDDVAGTADAGAADAGAADQAGSAVGQQAPQGALQGNVQQTGVPSGPAADAGAATGGDVGGLSAGPMGSLTPGGQTTPLQGYASQDEDLSAASGAAGRSTTGDVYGNVVSGGTGVAPSDPFPIDNPQASAPFQLNATENVPGAGLGGPTATGDVVGQVLRGGVGSTASNPFPLGATQNAGGPPLQGNATAADPWSKWNTGQATSAPTNPPLQGSASSTAPRAPLRGSASDTGGAPTPGAPNIQLIKQTPKFDTSPPGRIDASPPAQSGSFPLHAEQDKLVTGTSKDQFNLGAQKTGGAPPPGPGGGGGAPPATGANPPAPVKTPLVLQGHADAVLAVVKLPDHARVLSGPPTSPEDYNDKVRRGVEDGFSAGSSDEARATNKAFGLPNYTSIDPNQKIREQNEIEDLSEKEKLKLEGKENLDAFGKRVETATGLNPLKAKAAFDAPEKINDIKEAFGKEGEGEKGAEEAEKSISQMAKDQRALYKVQVVKFLAKNVAPVVGVMQDALTESREEVEQWSKFLDKYYEDVDAGKLSYDPYIPAYANGRLLYLTQKTFSDLRTMVGVDSKTIIDHLLKLK